MSSGAEGGVRGQDGGGVGALPAQHEGGDTCRYNQSTD